MKLVLLPGMDGTGNLFSPLLKELSSNDCLLLSLPSTGNQDYPSITKQIKAKLPLEDFILVAESFSGPIGAELARSNIPNMKGVIFVASFLSSPNKRLIELARLLPLRVLSHLPFFRYFYKSLFLGTRASDELVNLFQATLDSLPMSLINSRLKTMHSLVSSQQKSNIPAAYIQASRDKLVSANKISEFQLCFSDLNIKVVDGPHFILQPNPKECVQVINELVFALGR